jgi:broad specificity phosphatase PhoE
MAVVHFITHPDVLIDPAVPIPDWGLAPRGFSRLRAMLDQDWVAPVRAVWSSTERKAIEAADVLAAHLGVAPRRLAGLGENDRSATGYLPRAEFEATADLFFAHPATRIRGWESAAEAQLRIVAAVETVLAEGEGDVAILAHGAVGALLLCHLDGRPISRAADQPAGQGGWRFAFDRASRRLLHGWQPIDP